MATCSVPFDTGENYPDDDTELAQASSIGMGYTNSVRDPSGMGESQLLFSTQNKGKSMVDREIERLKELGFTKGLIKSIRENCKTFPLRIWILDNSGSMNKTDGNRVVEKANGTTIKVPCTRWAELQDTMNYHLDLVETTQTPTVLRFLNDPGIHTSPQRISLPSLLNNNNTISSSNNTLSSDIYKTKSTLRSIRPDGVTPLTNHILEIESQIRLMEPQLISDGQKVAIILATDGLPSNSNDAEDGSSTVECDEFHKALLRLIQLPVWLVVRLCTEEETVVNFYDKLDNELELPVDVLLDYVNEAEQVGRYNPWLTYGLPLHRCRELGSDNLLLDMLDERALTPGEIRDLCVFLFDVEDDVASIPNPAESWKGFKTAVKRLMREEGKVWNPRKKKVMDWIDLKELERVYLNSKCKVM